MSRCEVSNRAGDQCGDQATHSMMFRCGRCGQMHEAKLCDRHAQEARHFAMHGAPIRVWVVSDNGRQVVRPERGHG